MGIDFVIREIADARDLRRLGAFLEQQGLDYPNYDFWLREVCLPEIDAGWKTAIVACHHGIVVGNVVYQPHKNLPRTREIKNLRVSPDFRRQDLGHFLLRQAETENSGAFDRITLDVDARQHAILAFLRFCGYATIAQLPLYSSQNVDVLLHKEFSRESL